MPKPGNIYHPDRFRELYMRNYKALVMYALKMVEDESAAEDVVQDVFSEIWEEQRDFKDETHMRSYLYLCVRNRVTDKLRHNVVETKYAEQMKIMMRDTHAVDNAMLEEQVYYRLFEAIDELPEKQRAIFTHLMEGKKNTEIAEIMNVTINTIKTQKRHGMETLRKKLGEPEILLFVMLFA